MNILNHDRSRELLAAALALLATSSAAPAATTARTAQGSTALAFDQNFDSLAADGQLPEAEWNCDDAAWGTHSAAGLVVAGPVTPALAFAQASTRPFSNAQARASVAVSRRAGAGLFFGKDAETRYYVVRLAGPASPRSYAGMIELGLQDGDSYSVLDSESIQLDEWEWARLDLTILDSSCRVSLNTTPLLSARLPHPPRGFAGLYVDGEDPLLGDETLVASRIVDETAEVRLDDFHSGAGPLPPGLRGLALNLTLEEAIVARWADVQESAPAHAKRVEIVRTDVSGAREVLASSAGTFALADMGSFRVSWSDGRLSAMIGAESVCSAECPPIQGEVGALSAARPVAVFGGFRIRSLEVKPLKNPGEEQRVVVRVQAGGAAQPRYSTPLFKSSEVAGFISIPVSFDEPFGLELNLRSRSNQVLWFEPQGDGTVEARIMGLPEAPPVLLPKSAIASESPAVQLLYQGMSFWAFVGGHPVVSALRHMTGSFTVRYHSAKPGAAPPQINVIDVGGARRIDELIGSWVSLGYTFPAVAPAPWAHGDVSMAANVNLDAPGEKNIIVIQQEREAPNSGYRLEVTSGADPGWAIFKRGGQALLSNKLGPETPRDLKFRLQQNGSFISVFANSTLLFSAWDPSPLREGFGRWTREGRFISEEEFSVARRRWEVASIFHRKAPIAAGMALWDVSQGSWRVHDLNESSSAYVGTTDAAGIAALEYRGELESEDVLVELQIEPRSLFERENLIIDFLVAGGAQPVERIIFQRPTAETTKCTAMRNTRSIEEAIVHDLGRVLSVRRSPAELVVMIDHVPYATLNAPSGGLVHGLKVGLAGAPNEDIRIHSVAVTREPLDPLQVSGELTQLLEGLQDERP